MHLRHPVTRRGFLCLAGLAPLTPAAAQPEGPRQPIRLIVPFSPGTGSDTIARLLANELAGRFPQPLVVENRGGAGGITGTEQGARAAPDGLTLTLGTNSTLVVNPLLNPRVQYNVERDFAPVAGLARTYYAVVTANRAGAPQTLNALIERLRGGGGTYGSSGVGTVTHLASELLAKRIGAAATHVPYRGSGPAMTDVAGGAVDFAFESAAAAQPLVASGMLRALAVSSARPTPGLDLPTVAEAASLPGYAVNGSGGVLAPARTPAATIAALHEGFAAAMADATVRARITEAGTIPLAEGPEAFGRFIRDERRKWAEVARRGAIRIE